MSEKTFEIHSSNLDALIEKIRKANRRAERQKIAARFGHEILSERIVEKKNSDNEPTGEVDLFYEIRMDYPEVKLAGWEFLAVVQFEEAGAIINKNPAKELPLDFQRPESHRCDHCGISRDRKRSYIVENNGETKQVGSTCLQDFLGIEPKGLWILERFTAEEIEELFQPILRDGREYVTPTFSLDKVIKVALFVTNNGKRYVSQQKSLEWDCVDTRTEVVNILTWHTFTDPIACKARHEKFLEAMKIGDEMVAEVKQAIADMTPGDYASNMQTIFAGESVSLKSLGYAVSSVAVYNRAKNEKAEPKEMPSGFIGEPKQRIKDIPVTVTKVFWFETQWGMSAVNIFVTDDNKTIVWKTGTQDLEQNERYSLTATVKEHSIYRENDQTVVTRGKLVAID